MFDKEARINYFIGTQIGLRIALDSGIIGALKQFVNLTCFDIFAKHFINCN